MQKISSISEEYEAFLRRVISVLGAETLAEMSKHQDNAPAPRGRIFSLLSWQQRDSS
jgi:hypothetical protein